GHTEDDRADRKWSEGRVEVLGRDERQRGVAGLELDPRLLRIRVLRQAEGLAVELRRAVAVLHGHGDMWQTPESYVSSTNSIPRPSSSVRVSATSATRNAIGAPCPPLNSPPI